MVKKLKNIEIDNIINVLSDANSFKNNRSLKLSQADRQALRTTLKTLSDVYAIYEEGRRDIIMGYLEDGRADKDDDANIKIKAEYVPEFQTEFYELLMVENEVNLVPMSKEGVDKVLAIDLSIAEEDVVMLLFKDEEQKEAKPEE